MLISQCVGCRIMTASAFRLVPHEHQFHCAVLSASTSRGNEGWIHSTKRSVCLISQKQPADLLILPNVLLPSSSTGRDFDTGFLYDRGSQPRDPRGVFITCLSLSSRLRGEAHPGGSREDPDPPLPPEKNLHHHSPEPLPVRRKQRPHRSGLDTAGPAVPQLMDCV